MVVPMPVGESLDFAKSVLLLLRPCDFEMRGIGVRQSGLYEGKGSCCMHGEGL